MTWAEPEAPSVHTKPCVVGPYDMSLTYEYKPDALLLDYLPGTQVVAQIEERVCDEITLLVEGYQLCGHKLLYR